MTNPIDPGIDKELPEDLQNFVDALKKPKRNHWEVCATLMAVVEKDMEDHNDY